MSTLSTHISHFRIHGDDDGLIKKGKMIGQNTLRFHTSLDILTHAVGMQVGSVTYESIRHPTYSKLFASFHE